MTDDGLWTERQGGSLPLTPHGFATLLVDALAHLTAEGYLAEVLQLGGQPWAPSYVRGKPAEAFFAMKLCDPWAADAIRSVYSLTHAETRRIFDVLEVLHRDGVAKPELETTPGFSSYGSGSPAVSFDKQAGRDGFRASINPVLARCDPPLELLPSGIIVQQVAEPFRRLAATRDCTQA